MSRSASVAAEPLEIRSLLSVSALVVGTELSISSDGDDSIQVSAFGGNVLVVGGPAGGIQQPITSIGSVPASSIQSIVITGGDQENAIDLSNVRATDFLTLASILVQSGNGDDLLRGSPDVANHLQGQDGADTLLGGSGNDTLDGGDGADSITGAAGNDSILAGDGTDNVSGGDGNDTIDGGNGSDTISCGNGDDSVFAGNGEDTLNGDAGNDTLNGDGGTDTVSGDDGDDSILGGEFGDSLLGGLGNDTINGQGGNDSIDGQAGDDSLLGGAGADQLQGGVGNDFVNGNSGNDTLTGDDGNDSLLGGSGNDSMDGNGGNDTLLGQANNDTLVGGGGADNLNGGEDNDVLQSLSSGIVINDVTVGEGDIGVADAVFSVGLTVASTSTVTVQFSTSGGTAISGTDFTNTTGTLTFAPGVTLQTITVPIIGDTLQEPAEDFTLTLFNATNATIIDNIGLGTITDNDAPAGATLSAAPNINASRLGGNQDESAIAINPANPQQVFVFSNNSGGGTFAARSNDGGQTWLPAFGPDFIILDGNDALPAACCDPTLAWDSFGNLFMTYLEDVGAGADTLVALSTDGAQTFSLLARLGNGTDQPTVVVGPGTGGVGNSVWVTYDDGGIQISGAQVTGLGVVGAFSAPQATGVGQFGDIAVGPNGQVTVTGQSNTQMLFQTDPDGLGPQALGAVTSLPVNVDTFDVVTPQPLRTVDAEAGLVYDRTGGPFNGRLYLLYTDEPIDESNDTEIFSRFSTNNGATWSAPVRVNDDATIRAQIFSKIALDPTTGAVGAAWQDARNSATNTFVETFVSVSIDGGLTWAPNVRVSAGATNGTVGATGGQQLGDYIGLAYHGGQLIPSWADNSNSTGDNPNGTLQQIDIYTARVTVTINVAGGGGSSGSVGTPLPSVSDAGDTLIGGNGDDTLFGAGGNDFINAQSGNDQVNAGGGDDSVLGGGGADTLNGGDGDDTLNGQGGADSLIGGAGNDTHIWDGAGSGSDVLSDESGDNTLLVIGSGAANVFDVAKNAGRLLTVTESGKSVTVGPTFNTVIVDGGNGGDTINVGDLTGVAAIVLDIRGGNGDDRLSAAGSPIGNVRLIMDGGEGFDTLLGGLGEETLVGGAGSDLLDGGAGNDTLRGGDGGDTLDGGAGDDSLSGELGDDSLRGSGGNDIGSGGDGDDTLDGGAGNDTLSGNNGFDSLLGTAGDDSLLGGIGGDTLGGGAGTDVLDGGRNDDSLLGDVGDDKIRGDHGNDTIDGGDGNDTINGGDGNDTIVGGLGNDGINGADGDDNLNAGAGDDTLIGGDGNDTLLGGGGSDIVLGEDGDDNVNGQSGTDTVAGNQGVDVIADPAAEIQETFVLSAAIRTLLDAA